MSWVIWFSRSIRESSQELLINPTRLLFVELFGFIKPTQTVWRNGRRAGQPFPSSIFCPVWAGMKVIFSGSGF